MSARLATNQWLFTMALAITGTFFTSTSGAAEKSDYCEAGGQKLAVGSSLWIDDPFLSEMGAGKDWAGFRVVCRQQVKISANSSRPGGVVVKSEPVLVLSELSDDYHQHVQETLFQHL